ncbi:MAG: DUF2461 domain-containing protein [Vicinamibacterales bacterium]
MNLPNPFTAKTLSFLRALSRNNDRAWFHARRDEYEKHVRGPMLVVVGQVSEAFASFAPEMVADPKISLFRPWRDTRFSENKAPLKTNVAAVFPHRGLGRMNGAALYFEVAPKAVWIGGGLYAPDTSQLQAVREHVGRHHRQLEALAASPAFKKIGGLKGEQMARVPRGVAKDHPAAAYLRYRQFLGFREEAAEFATRPDFCQHLIATFKALMPLCQFLNEPILVLRKANKRAHILDEEP